MNVYKLTTSSGSYDDFYRIEIGIYKSPELAEIAKKEFIDKVNKIKELNPCPFNEEIIYDIENYINDNTEMQDQYNSWRYGKMYDIFNLNMDVNIQTIKLNETDLNFLNNE